MKRKIMFGLLAFFAFLSIVIWVIVKENKLRDELSTITGETIRNVIKNDDGMSMDEISDTFAKESLEKVGYENIADIAYIKIDGEKIYLVFIENNLESTFYLATRLLDEMGKKTFLITWDGAEYEINKEQAKSEEEFEKMFPEEWSEMFENGIQIGAGTADEIDGSIEKAIDKFN